MLIKFRPQKECDSLLLNDFQISNLSDHMALHRNLQWVLLYRLSEHGVSMTTFLERTKNMDTTLLIIEDSKGWKFGGLCHEEWQANQRMHGTGDNFVFTFKDGDSCDIFTATGDNEMYQFCDRKFLALGGGSDEGRFALYLGDDFLRGATCSTTCFENE